MRLNGPKSSTTLSAGVRNVENMASHDLVNLALELL